MFVLKFVIFFSESNKGQTLQKFVTFELPHHLYLVRTRSKESIGEKQNFSLAWGARSEVEFSRKEILDFIQHFYGSHGKKENFWIPLELRADKADTRIEDMLDSSKKRIQIEAEEVKKNESQRS